MLPIQTIVHRLFQFDAGHLHGLLKHSVALFAVRFGSASQMKVFRQSFQPFLYLLGRQYRKGRLLALVKITQLLGSQVFAGLAARRLNGVTGIENDGRPPAVVGTALRPHDLAVLARNGGRQGCHLRVEAVVH